MFMILAVTPPFQQIEKTTVGNHVMLVLFFAIAAIGVPAILIIMIGMAIFCVFLDRSSVGAKILWFLFFFFTGPLGSIVYFFGVYKKLAAAHQEGVNA
jgi:membrane protein implicated in regulation of membrane protease activity